MYASKLLFAASCLRLASSISRKLVRTLVEASICSTVIGSIGKPVTFTSRGVLNTRRRIFIFGTSSSTGSASCVASAVVSASLFASSVASVALTSLPSLSSLGAAASSAVSVTLAAASSVALASVAFVGVGFFTALGVRFGLSGT